MALADPIREALAPLADRIKPALLYGSVAKGTETATSDIDILILSDSLSYADVMVAMEAVEGRLGRQVNPTLYTHEDLKRRHQEGNAFVGRILSQPKIWLKGNEHDVLA